MKLPLLHGHRPESAIAWRSGKSISAEEFIGSAHALASRLPELPFVFNLCHDRYHFLLAFAAALIRGQTSLLPPTRLEDSLRKISEGFSPSYCLIDEPLNLEGMEVVEVRHFGAQRLSEIPSVPQQAPAIIAFTSGSTGAPTPHLKTWRSLVAIARATASRIQFGAGQNIVGTIPPQHMYGLETTIMLPLQAGGALATGHPLTPADIAASLAALPTPRWLATTPMHLQACIAENAALPKLSGVICATMALSGKLCEDAENLTGATIHEIYGCTEAGTVALRRPSATQMFTLCGETVLREIEEDAWVEAPHLPHPVKLPDRISVIDERTFILHGRKSDMVKIAGKRASLAALTNELMGIRGVRDGVFYFPEQGQRLMAFAVAPGMTAQSVVAQLRHRIDPVFLPRPLVLLESLPRNSTGKLPRENLAELAHSAAAEIAR
jgi:acyl-coenzyme A synthetase/AMP-(fatty) acid ligase